MFTKAEASVASVVVVSARSADLESKYLNPVMDYYQKNKEAIKAKNLARYYLNHEKNLERRRELYKVNYVPNQRKVTKDQVVFYGKSFAKIGD